MSERKREIMIHADIVENVVDMVHKIYNVNPGTAWEIVTESSIYTAIQLELDGDILVMPAYNLARLCVTEFNTFLANAGQKITPRPAMSTADRMLFMGEI